MKIEEFKNMIRELVREELASMSQDTDQEKTCEGEGCLDEKSVPEPYDRKSSRKMSKSQIEKRDRIGKSMENDETTASKFRKKYGQDWKSYLWRAATSAAFRERGSAKSDDKKKK